jgi:dTMP kinase
LMMAQGLFITLEGIEGSGKTSQAARLAEQLRAAGRGVMLTHEPGGTRAGEAIRAIFLDPAVSLNVSAELLLVLADRAQHVVEKLKPALERGDIVISDRYADSTTAYQGYGRGFDLKLLGELNRLASDSIVPDLTIVLDCAVETGLARTRQRTNSGKRGPDRFEGADLDFHRRVRAGFLTLARNDLRRFRLLDSERSADEVFADITRLVDDAIGTRWR